MYLKLYREIYLMVQLILSKIKMVLDVLDSGNMYCLLLETKLLEYGTFLLFVLPFMYSIVFIGFWSIYIK